VYRCFDELDDAVVILDRDNTVAWLNRSFQETFGVEDEAARGMETGAFITRCLAPFIPEGERAGPMLVDALRSRQEVADAACRMGTAAGEVRWFSFSCRPMAGAPYAGMTLVRFRDITARRHAEDLTAVRAAQQAAIADLGQFALAGAGPQELMDAAVRMVAGHLEVEYAKVLRYLPGEDAFVLEAAVGFSSALLGTACAEGGTDSQAGYTLLSHEPVIVEDLRTETRFTGPALLRDEGIASGISVIIQGEKTPYGVLGAHTRTRRRFTRDDINFVQAAANILAQGIERRAAEEALLASEEKFREIAQRSFDMIYTCYHDDGITYISPAVTRILGYTPEELTGHKCRDYVSPLSLAAWEEGQRKIARGEPVEGLEVEFRRKDGTTAFVELNESAILEHGKVVGVQAVGRDITERRQHELLRQQAFYQIERNIEQFAVLGDHIRQPLQVTLGRAELLEDEVTAGVIREQVERINDYIRQLDRGGVESRKVRNFLRRHDLK